MAVLLTRELDEADSDLVVDLVLEPKAVHLCTRIISSYDSPPGTR